jgi:hypothetical protein
VVISDADHALRDRFGVKPGALILVRPDGYVAYRGEAADVAKLRAYLGELFALA